MLEQVAIQPGVVGLGQVFGDLRVAAELVLVVQRVEEVVDVTRAQRDHGDHDHRDGVREESNQADDIRAAALWETFLKGEPCSSTSAASERERECLNGNNRARKGIHVSARAAGW